jgi:hypothetical protein
MHLIALACGVVVFAMMRLYDNDKENSREKIV